MSNNYEEMFGPVVGQGAQATVYAKGEYAVKFYREGYPKPNVFAEAGIMVNLEMEGFPGPKVYEIVYVDGRYGLRMDRVKGKMLMDVWHGKPENWKEHINVLVELQCHIQNDFKAAWWIPVLKSRFRLDLVNNDCLSVVIKDKLLDMLDKLPEGQAFCHCDFHAGNVFFDGEDYKIIDLLQISRGEPAADAACSYVAYMTTDREIADYYLEQYCAFSGVSMENVLQWLPLYAGTVLGKLPEEYTPLIERFIHAGV